jgi:hypothetical protein
MKAVLAALLGGSLALAGSRAAAQCQDEACVRTSTPLPTVSAQQSAVLDGQLNSLLGSGSAADLTAAQYSALANSTLTLSNLTAALNAAGVGAHAEGALSTSTSLGTILTAASTSARAQGSVSAADALDTLRAQTSSVNAGTIQLGDLLQADTRAGPLASSQLNALDLVTGTASLFNEKNVATVQQVTLSGAALGLGASIASVQLSTVVLKPALFVCGPVGTQFYSASTRVRARLALTGSGVDLTVPGLSSARVNLVSLDLVAAVGRASGSIAAIDALAGTLSVKATPGVAELYLGTISDASFIDRTTAIDPATELTPAVLGNLALKLLLLNASAQVSIKSYAKGTTPSERTLSFSAPYPRTLIASTQAGFAGTLVDTLLSNLTVTMGPITPSLGLVGSALTTLLNDVSSVVTSSLKSGGGVLKPLLDSTLTGVVDPALAPLGVKLGEVSVTAGAPYKVSAGSACNDLAFCTENDLCGASGVCAGTPKTCSDNVACTTDSCNEASDVCVNTLANSCVIDGACVPAGATDPSNDCRACVPTSSSTGWSLRPLGSACNDGLFCTAGDTCNGLGVCTASPRLCDDGLACTLELCDETLDRCTTGVTAGCVINGACVLPGADDPSNACRSCNPLLSTTNYSNKGAGSPCADGLFCTTGDACDGAGSCASTPRSCEDGISCTHDACDEASDSCTSGVSGGCLILGACVLAGADNPLNPCLTCNPALSTSSWTPRATGASCSDGLFCTTGDSCSALGVCVGSPRVCDPGGSDCSSVCDELTDSCRASTSGCLIGGACVAPGTDDPGNPCRTCDPAISLVSWVGKALGSACSDGLFCTTGDACNGTGSCVGMARDCSDSQGCTSESCDEANDRCSVGVSGGCTIGGACVASGAPEPGNPCRTCDPAISTTTYSSSAAGTSCSDGLFCTTGDVCNGEGACTGAARDCNHGAAGCASVCDELADACRSGIASCTIDGACVAAGTADPSNPCRECNPALSPAGWSNKAAGAQCDDGLYCTTGETCSPAGACLGTPRSCGDDSCGSLCNEAQDTCSSGLSGCNILGVCYAAGDPNPLNACLVCNPSLSLLSWSPKGAGASCSDGLFCTRGETCDALGVCSGSSLGCSDGLDCTSDFCDESADRCSSTPTLGCVIGGACVAAGALDPTNPCRSCNPPVSTSTYSNLPAAVACNDGLFCTIGDGCDGQGACAGVLRSCGAGASCESFCDEATDACRSDVTGCAIGDVCLSAGTDDPSNPCRTCNPLLASVGFSNKAAGTACNDGAFCTSGDNCDALGLCVGQPQGCSDGQTCTLDLCDEASDACRHSSASSCVIDGACVAAGASAPGAPCMVCDPLQSASGWSSARANVSCDDGAFCTAVDRCDGSGACVGSGTRCPGDGLGCTTEVCDEATDSCTVSVELGCAIAGQCWEPGAVSLSDLCFVCQPENNLTAFSYVPKKPGCDSDLDGLRDGWEQAENGEFIDSDQDGKFDHLDPDDDGDSLLTRNEHADSDRDGSPSDARDFDEDGVADYLDLDDDGDDRATPTELGDVLEFAYSDDVDEDDAENWLDFDTDGDGASDWAENCGDGDSDDSNVPDYLEENVQPLDDDRDGIPTAAECVGGGEGCRDSDGDGRPDWDDVDDDDDTVFTKFELSISGAPARNTDAYDARTISPRDDFGQVDTSEILWDYDTADDHLDADDDGDTLLTRDELPDPNGDGDPVDAVHHDEDGKPDYLDHDDDGDNVSTKKETQDERDRNNALIDAGVDEPRDGSLMSPRDAGRDSGRSTEAGPLPVRDASRGGLSGGALCSTSGGATASGWALGWLVLAWGGLWWRRRQR